MFFLEILSSTKIIILITTQLEKVGALLCMVQEIQMELYSESISIYLPLSEILTQALLLQHMFGLSKTTHHQILEKKC